MLNRNIHNMIKVLLSISLLLFVAVSCKTKRINTPSSTDDVASYSIPFETLNGKCKFTLSLGEKSFSTNGLLRMKKDSIIQLSIQPILGVEVARAYFTKNEFALIDRMNKQYLKMDYEDLGKNISANINFHSVQSLFANTIFAYEKEEDAQKTDFEETTLMPGNNFLQRSYKQFSQEFVTDSLHITQSGSILGENLSMRWTYYDFFHNIGQRLYPMKMEIQLKLQPSTPSYMLNISYSKIETNTDMNFAYTIPASYKSVSLQELIQQYFKK